MIAKNGETETSYIGLAQSAKNAFRLMGNGIRDIPMAAAKKGIDILEVSFHKLGSVGKKAMSLIASGLKNVASSMLMLGKNTKSSNGMLQSGFKNMLKYGLGIRSLYALINKLKSAVKEGVGNLAQYSAPVNAALSSLKSSLTQLKNSLATAFAPILTAVAPALTTLINLASKAATTIGMLIAYLTGQKTFTKATAVQEDYAESLKKTSCEAKKANKQLSSLDKLNNLTTQDKDSGTGGGGTADISDMFETVNIPDGIKGFADRIKQAWKDADFTDIGTTIGTKLKGALDSIPWETIQPTAEKVGKSLATLINGAIEVEGLGASIGNTIAQAINTGFEFLNSFVHNLHWDSIGAFIADSINGFFQNIDWNLIYDTFVAGAKGLGDAINSFMDNLDWESISASISNFINTFVDTIYTFVTTVNWKELGEKVGKTISDAWKGIDWKKVGETLSKVFIAFFDFVGNAIEAVDWQQVGKGIKDFLMGIDWAGIAESFFKAVGAALGGLAALLYGLIKDAWNEVVKWWRETAFEDGKFTINGLFLGILEVLGNIGMWIREHIFKPFIDGFKKAFGIHSPSKVLAEQGGYIISGLLKGLKNNISSVLDWLKNIPAWFKEKFDLAYKNAKNAFSGAKQFFAGIWNNIKGVFGNIASWFKDKFTSAWTAVKNVFSTGGKIFNGIKDGILNGLKSVINALISGINKVIKVPFDGLNSSIEKIKAIKIGALKPFDFLPSISVPQIPKLATGAVIPANKEFLAVLGDQKHGTNIEAPLSTIEEASKKAILEVLSKLGVSAGNSRNSGNETFVFQVDGRTFFEITRKYAEEYFERTGNPAFPI